MSSSSWMSQDSTQDVVRRLAKIHAEGKSVLEATAGQGSPSSPSKSPGGLTRNGIGGGTSGSPFRGRASHPPRLARSLRRCPRGLRKRKEGQTNDVASALASLFSLKPTGNGRADEQPPAPLKLDAAASIHDQAEASAAAATRAAAATARSTNDTVSNHAADGDENDRIQSNDDAKITKADDVSPPNAPSSPPAQFRPLHSHALRRRKSCLVFFLEKVGEVVGVRCLTTRLKSARQR